MEIGETYCQKVLLIHHTSRVEEGNERTIQPTYDLPIHVFSSPMCRHIVSFAFVSIISILARETKVKTISVPEIVEALQHQNMIQSVPSTPSRAGEHYPPLSWRTHQVVCF